MPETIQGFKASDPRDTGSLGVSSIRWFYISRERLDDVKIYEIIILNSLLSAVHIYDYFISSLMMLIYVCFVQFLNILSVLVSSLLNISVAS